MPEYNVVYESKEKVLGVVPRANDWVEYTCDTPRNSRTPISRQTPYPEHRLKPRNREICQYETTRITPL